MKTLSTDASGSSTERPVPRWASTFFNPSRKALIRIRYQDETDPFRILAELRGRTPELLEDANRSGDAFALMACRTGDAAFVALADDDAERALALLLRPGGTPEDPARVDARRFDPDVAELTRIGSGSLGGKALGVAFLVLRLPRRQAFPLVVMEDRTVTS